MSGERVEYVCMKTNIKQILTNKINSSEWWHVTPMDPDAYSKRGKFLASTYKRAEFYGRPNDIPEKVDVRNPVYGFSEKEILEKLFPDKSSQTLINNILKSESWYEKRIELDAKMIRKAEALGYDAIVLICSNGKKALQKRSKPRSIELNLVHV